MDLRYHIGRRLAAVAVVGGGGAAALFGGAAAHTQFSATSSQKLTVAGGAVSETITNGSFTCSGLIPPNNFPELGSSPPATYQGTTCAETVSFNNTGSVPESFDVQLSPASGTPAALTTAALNQLYIQVGTGSAAKTYDYGDLMALLPSNPFHVATVAAGSSLSETFTIGLSANTSSTDQNDWNNASISIPYTVTATPSAS